MSYTYTLQWCLVCIHERDAWPLVGIHVGG